MPKKITPAEMVVATSQLFGLHSIVLAGALVWFHGAHLGAAVVLVAWITSTMAVFNAAYRHGIDVHRVA